jgi:DNA mismatch repair ATPase MutS
MSSSSASALLSQTNDLLEKLARLNSNVELYTQVHSLQQNFNSLEENYNSLQNNIKTSTCNAQCNDLNARNEPNSVEDFLVQLLLSKYKSNPPSTVPQDVVLKSAPPIPINDYQSSLLEQASAPPLEASVPQLEASAPPL